jgi:pyrroloquinoline quinone biosynthesis protein E
MRVLREACDLGLVELRLLGGEPLFRLDDTVQLLTEANRMGVQRAVVYTSAVEETSAWLLSLLAFRPMHVGVEASIYAASATIHDGITLAPGSFDRLLASSREAIRLGVDLSWNFVWMRPTLHDLPAVVALASEVGIRRIRILRLMLNGRARANRAILEPESLALQFPRVELAYSKPLVFQLAGDGRGDPTRCGAGGTQLIIQSDGLVFPCVGMKGTPDLQLGDVRTESLHRMLQRSHSAAFGTDSLLFHECPAVLFQQQPGLIHISR